MEKEAVYTKHRILADDLVKSVGATDALATSKVESALTNEWWLGYYSTHDGREELTALRSLILEMGHAIRRLDEDHQYLEFWTQDGEYILDGRFR